MCLLRLTWVVQTDKHFLNNAAFGRAYDSVLELSFKLRRFAETSPDIFYDQACLPLVDYTYSVLQVATRPPS